MYQVGEGIWLLFVGGQHRPLVVELSGLHVALRVTCNEPITCTVIVQVSEDEVARRAMSDSLEEKIEFDVPAHEGVIRVEFRVGGRLQVAHDQRYCLRKGE